MGGSSGADRTSLYRGIEALVNNKPGSERVRVGVVGLGWVAKDRHIPAFKRDGRATIVALMDNDNNRAQESAKKLHVPHYFDNLDDFLQEQMDVVSICTPPWIHASVIEAAIKAGKHVLVEKPMTLKAEEGKYLEKLAQEKGVVLCPAHNFLFSRSMQRAEKLIKSGEVGELQWTMGIQLSSWQRRLPTWYGELPGGLFFDEAPHLLYLTKHFLGELHVEQAWRSCNGEAETKTERIEARLQGGRGAAYLTMWFGAPFSEWLLMLFCSRAVLVLDLFRDIIVDLPPEKAHNARDVMKTSIVSTLRLWRGIGSSGALSVCGKLYYGHDHLVRQFLNSVIHEKQQPPVSAQDGWEVVALIEEILQRSAERC